MPKYEELTDAISRKKNSSLKGAEKRARVEDEDQDLEVAGTESTKVPLVSFASDETDMDLTDQLYFKAKHRPNDGSGTEGWD